MASPTITMHWRLAWYARLILNVANATMIGRRSIIPRRVVRWVVMNNWMVRAGETGKWTRTSIDQRGQPCVRVN